MAKKAPAARTTLQLAAPVENVQASNPSATPITTVQHSSYSMATKAPTPREVPQLATPATTVQDNKEEVAIQKRARGMNQHVG